MLKAPSALVWFGLLFLTAAFLGVLLPPDPATLQALNITVGVYDIAVIALILPYGVIWFSAFYAYWRLKQYADKVAGTREGNAFKNLAYGVGVLAWGLAVPTLVAFCLGAIVSHYPNFETGRALIFSYLSMIVSLASFIIISRGTRQFAEIVKVRPSRHAVMVIILAFATIGAFYVSLVVHAHDIGHNPYHLPLPLLICTLVIPHMFAWFVGLFSAYELQLYTRRISGVLYKHSLTYFTWGFGIVVCSAIAFQYVIGAYIYKSNISLSSVLLASYSFFALEGIGYALIALAAQRLKRLEEV